MGSKVVGLYNPVRLVVPAGQTLSQRLVIGRSQILGFWIENYTGSIYINVSDKLTGTDSTKSHLVPHTVIDNTQDIDYCHCQVPRDVVGARYTEYVSTTDRVYVSVDFSIFMGVPCIELELATAAPAGGVMIDMIVWDVK